MGDHDYLHDRHVGVRIQTQRKKHRQAQNRGDVLPQNPAPPPQIGVYVGNRDFTPDERYCNLFLIPFLIFIG